MKIKPLLQKDSNACGPTCIKMAIDYLKYPLTLHKIEKVSKYRKRNGLSNNQIVGIVKKLGIQIQTKNNATWNDLSKYNTKNHVLLVSWMLNGYIGHFSIVESVSKNHIVLADPEKGGFNTLTKIVFLRLWFDYDESWFPHKNTDIQLRWLAIISKK